MEKDNSLKLEDMDDVELLEAVEEAFEVRFDQSEVETLQTVGDLFDLLQAKMGTTSQRRQRCLSAISFYRLKKAVLDISGVAIAPRTAIVDVFPARELQSCIRRLKDQTGLKLASVPASSEQVLLFLLGLSSCAAAFYFGLTQMAGITALLIGIGFFCVLRFARFPRAMKQHSFGELAREAAFRNYGRLARESGTYSSIDLWKALDFMIRDSVAFNGEITRETRLV